MTDWHDIARWLLSGDPGSLIFLACLFVIAIALSSAQEIREVLKRMISYALTFAVIIGALWAGYSYIG